MAVKGLSLYSNFLMGKNEVGVAIDSARGKLKRYQREARMASKASSGIFKGVLGANIVGRGMSMVTLGIAGATREMISFDNAITATGAKFGPTFARGTKGFRELGAVARKVGGETEFTATQAAQGLDFLAKAGFNAKQSIALLPGIVDLATGSGEDLARASDIASDSLGAFGLMSKDSATLGSNLARVMDVMAKTATSSNTDLNTMFEAITKGAPTFTAAGQSIETFNTLVGTLANSGIKGSEAGTALRNIMLRLSKPTGEAAEVIKSLGVETQDADGNFRDAVDILGQFEKSTKGMGNAQRTAALNTVFGARAVSAVNLLLKSGQTELEGYREKLNQSAGAARGLADAMRTSIQNRLKKVQSSAIELGLKFFDLFGPKIEGMIGNIQGALDGFNTNFAKTAETALAVIENLKSLGTTIKWVGGAWLGYKAVMLGVSAVTGIQMLLLKGQIAGIAIYSGAIKGLSIATKAFAVAQGILNVVMTANPIGLAIIGIAALSASVILLIENFDAVADAAKAAWGWVKGFVGADSDTEVNANSNKTFSTDLNLDSPNSIQAGAMAGGGVLRSEHMEKKESFMQMIPPEGWGVEKVPDVGVMSTKLPLGDTP